MLSRAQFDHSRSLALRLTGIELFDRHHAVLSRRARSAGLANPAEFDALVREVERGVPHARRRFVAMITTGFTGFFRHPHHFDLAAEYALYAAHRRGVARLWSAAASTGEEPYSLAMVLDEVLPTAAAMVLGTDIDEDALTIAQVGEYPTASIDAVPTAMRARSFALSADGLRARVIDAVRARVTFRPLNLADVHWPIEGGLDVVMCRNVLMYLDAGHRYAVLERIASLLAPDGLLLLDPTEHVGAAAHFFSRGTQGVYAPRPRIAASRR